MLGIMFALLLGTAHKGQALQLHLPSIHTPCSTESFYAHKRAAYAAHARLSSELACRYYFQGHTFAYPPQSPRALPVTSTRTRRTWPWWRRAVRKLRRWRRWWTECLKRVFAIA